MSRINLLPKWVFPDSRFSVYDTESGTAVEMVSKVYNAMRTLQADYNKFVDEMNKSITDFMTSTNKSQADFISCIDKLVHDYIKMLDDKFKMQDLVIDNAVKYMKENIVETSRNVVTQAIKNNEISIIANYENEVLFLNITDNGGGE